MSNLDIHQASALYINLKLQITWLHKVYKRNICGGSIYSENVIITAAHCCDAIFSKWDENDFVIVAGEYSLSEESGKEQTSKVKAHRIHPEYDSKQIKNDICLLYLEIPFDLSGGNVTSVELATEDPEIETICDISGWGTLDVSY